MKSFVLKFVSGGLLVVALSFGGIGLNGPTVEGDTPFSTPGMTGFERSLTPLAFAQDDGEEDNNLPTIPRPDFLPGPDEEQSQDEVQSYFRNEAIPTFISGLLGIIAGVALLALVVSGIRFITAFGEEEGVTAAKKTAIWSVIGFGITLLAYTIVSIINTLAFPEESYSVDDQETVQYEDI